MNRPRFFVSCLIFLLSTPLAYGQVITQQLRGVVIDRQTHQKLSGTTVALKNTALFCVTDSNGNFYFKKLPIGRYNVEIKRINYQIGEINNIELNSGKELVLEIELEEAVHLLKEVVIKSTKNKDQPQNPFSLISTRQFGPQEAVRYAGGFQDPARMALAFAGVTSSGSDDNNDIVIRGNSPRGLLWRLEGVEIPNPNHFADGQGSTSGIVSMINAPSLSSSDFMTGAFPAEYGNGSSGVFDLNFRRGNNQKMEYNAQLSLVGLDFGAEGPLNKKGGSFRITARYSTLEILLNAKIIKIETANYNPSFKDLNFTFELPTQKSGTFTVWGLLGNDATVENKALNKYQDKGNLSIVGLTHKLSFKKGLLKSILVMSHQAQENLDQNLQKDATWLTARKMSYRYPSLRWSTAYTHKFNAQFSLQGGLILSQLNYGLNDDRINSKNVLLNYLNENGNTFFIQNYIQGIQKIGTKIKSTFGVHHYNFLLNNASAVEPRWALQVGNSVGGKFSAGIGWHSRLEPVSIYLFKKILTSGATVQPNKNLVPSSAFHFVVAYEQRMNEQTKIKIEAYLQNITGVPIDSAVKGTFSLLNSGAGIPNFVMENAGYGKNKGIEFTLERFFSANFYYLITASLFDTKYQNKNNIWYNTIYNNKYAGNLLLGKEFVFHKKNALSINFKYMLRGGNRYTPIILSESIKRSTTIVDATQLYNAQYPNYWRTDFSISYKINRRKSTWSFGADIQNLTDRKNVISTYYDNTSKSILNNYALPRIPIIFFRTEF